MMFSTEIPVCIGLNALLKVNTKININEGANLRKNKKQSLDPKDHCQAQADEVKYIMLLNALNESHRRKPNIILKNTHNKTPFNKLGFFSYNLTKP